jgi:hypothetical protein
MGFGFVKIKILKSAKEDLKEGFYLYELQQKGKSNEQRHKHGA